MICCETVRRQKQNCTRATLCCWQAAVNAAHRQFEGLTVPSRRYSHKSSSRFFFSILQTGGKRSIDQETAALNPAKSHHTSEPIFVEERCILAHIQPRKFVGSFCNKLVDHSCNRIHGIRMLLDLTTVCPSYGTAVQVALAH